MKRIEILGCPMDSASMSESVSLIEEGIACMRFTQHVVVNVAKVVNMRKDKMLDDSVRECDIINIDGMGVVWGARALGHSIPERVAGVDLFHELLSMSSRRGFSVFLLGAEELIVEETSKRVQILYPDIRVAGYHHGYFWDDEEAVVTKIRESGARLLFVAISSPKKETFISRWKDQLGIDFVMGVGGTFDVVAGKVKRAPVWMQSMGLEWFFRILQEPRRMWKRYFSTNLEFGRLLFIEWLQKQPTK